MLFSFYFKINNFYDFETNFSEKLVETKGVLALYGPQKVLTVREKYIPHDETRIYKL